MKYEGAKDLKSKYKIYNSRFMDYYSLMPTIVILKEKKNENNKSL